MLRKSLNECVFFACAFYCFGGKSSSRAAVRGMGNGKVRWGLYIGSSFSFLPLQTACVKWPIWTQAKDVNIGKGVWKLTVKESFSAPTGFKAEFSLVVSFNLKIADVSKRSHLLGVYLQGHFAPQLLSHSSLFERPSCFIRFLVVACRMTQFNHDSLFFVK